MRKFAKRARSRERAKPVGSRLNNKAARHSVDAGIQQADHHFDQINIYANPAPGIQAKKWVSSPGDESEKEADEVANKVMRMPDSTQIQRKCAACEDEEKKVQRKTGPSGAGAKAGTPAVSPMLSSKLSASQAHGSRIDGATQSFMGERFGVDFSNVKVHTDAEAAQMNRELNARAFTLGRDIYFNSGEYAPHLNSGRHLLAHELVHTVQQGSVNKIHRKEQPDAVAAKLAPSDADAVKTEQEIITNPVFLKLDPTSQARVHNIITVLKGKPDKRLYYLNKLKEAVTTPFTGAAASGVKYACSPALEKANREAVAAATDTEDKYWHGLFNDVDEMMVASSRPADIRTRTGEGGKKFTVDSSDPNNIRVKIKIKLNGKTDDVDKIKHLEDAIERSVSIATRGYYLDIVFVDAPGPDVFEFTVNFCIWPNSGNWASPPATLSHEVHHALGLNDRYDYIESHSTNPDMNVEMRLVWFEQELKKAPPQDLPNNPKSKMSNSANPLLNDDVCAVAYDPGAERENCIKARDGYDKYGF